MPATALKLKLIFISSLNIDFITRTPRIPEPGETLNAVSFDTGFGGKGANQAVACARLASRHVVVEMAGNVGDDTFGADYFKGLEKEGIVTKGVRVIKESKTGVSNIIVDQSTGENRILFTANANYIFSDTPSPDWDMVPEAAKVVVFQLEIPLRVVLHNIRIAHERSNHVIFNPAPAQPIPDSEYESIDTLIMNETELQIMAGSTSHAKQDASCTELAKGFLDRGVKDAVIVTLGSRGLVYVTSSGEMGEIAARSVSVVDTTAAGDTFVGAYAVQRANHTDGRFDYRDALNFATLAASKSVEKPGAMAAIPYLKELE